MELNTDEIRTQSEAVAYMELHKNELIKEFVLDKNPLRIGFMTIFMAGSPGAGKTEFSQRYMPLIIDGEGEKLKKFLEKKGVDLGKVGSFFVRVDVDEIRCFLPQYKKTNTTNGEKANAHVVQKAANIGLDILRDYCLENEISFLHDGTFGNYSTMKKIVKKSIKAGREVQIYYLYLDPVTAWKFTKAREYLEGRNIVQEKFIEQYLASKENVSKIKHEFGDAIKIHCVLKNDKNEVDETVFNVPDIDKYLETKYNKNLIKRYTKEELFELLT